jgi:protein ImuB
MSRNVCTRVACLRLPWFQIDVLRRAGHVARGAPVAVVQGQGAHARVTLMDPAGRALGLTPGMRPSRARALAADVQLQSWDAGAEALQEEATEALSRGLETLTPRWSLIAPGHWWLEPAAQKLDLNAAPRDLEMAFADRVVRYVTGEGFLGARVGIADGPTAAAAATRDGGRTVVWVGPGSDRSYLAKLPTDALPLSERSLRLLDDLGLHRVGALQSMSAQALEARLGPEGRRAWTLSQGDDPRRPRAHSPEATTRLVLPLLSGCREVEPLLFVLRPALERLVEAHAQRGRAVAHLEVTLEHAWGDPHSVIISPSRAVSDAPLLMELLRLRLTESMPFDGQRGPIVTLILEALRVTPQRPRQADLFRQAERTTEQAEGALIRLVGRLGKGAVRVPGLCDERRPEASGAWHVLTDLDRPQPPAPEQPALSACLRLLPEPRALTDSVERPDRLSFEGRVVHPTHWHGPERLSGHWWSDLYDRDYYWVSTREGFALWLFRARREGRWFLHGWLD